MENIWVDKNFNDPEEIDQIGEHAMKKLNSVNNAPTKEVLGAENQAHVEERFLKTNDDTLQEDYAQHLIKGNYPEEKMEDMAEFAKETEEKLIEKKNKKKEQDEEIHELINKLVRARNKWENLINSKPKHYLPKEALEIINEEIAKAKAEIALAEKELVKKTNSANFNEEVSDNSRKIEKEYVDLLDRLSPEESLDDFFTSH